MECREGCACGVTGGATGGVNGCHWGITGVSLGVSAARIRGEEGMVGPDLAPGISTGIVDPCARTPGAHWCLSKVTANSLYEMYRSESGR